VTEENDRGKIDAAREELLDTLALAKPRLRQLSYSAAMPGGDEQGMHEAEQSVRRIEQKLQGLAYGLEQVASQERERREVEKLAKRREDAMETLSLMHRRLWETEVLDEALDAVGLAIDRIDELGQDLVYATARWHEEGAVDSDAASRDFLMSIDAIDGGDTVFRVRSDLGRPRRYAGGLPQKRPWALKALVRLMPEAEDPTVQEEALAKARREQERSRGEDGSLEAPSG